MTGRVNAKLSRPDNISLRGLPLERVLLKLGTTCLVAFWAGFESRGRMNLPLLALTLTIFLLDFSHPFTLHNIVLIYITALFEFGSGFFTSDPHQTKLIFFPILAFYLLGYWLTSWIRPPGKAPSIPRARIYQGVIKARDAKPLVKVLTLITILITAIYIFLSGIHQYYSGQTLALSVKAYATSGGALGIFPGMETILTQLLTSAVAFYAAQCFVNARPVAYRWVVGPLIVLPVVTLQRAQGFVGAIVLMGIYAMDRRTRIRRQSGRRRQLYTRLTLVALFVVVAGISIGRIRQQAIANGSSAPAASGGTSAYLKEELTPIQAFSEIRSSLQQLKEQHGRTIVVPLLLRYVPRSLYPAKALNSDSYYMESLHSGAYSAGFSMPVTIFGDGYLSFGLVGLLAASLLLGVATRAGDRAMIRSDRFRAVSYLLGAANIYNVLRDCLANSGAQIVLMTTTVFVIGLFLRPRSGVHVFRDQGGGDHLPAQCVSR